MTAWVRVSGRCRTMATSKSAVDRPTIDGVPPGYDLRQPRVNAPGLEILDIVTRTPQTIQAAVLYRVGEPLAVDAVELDELHAGDDQGAAIAALHAHLHTREYVLSDHHA